MPAYLVAMMTVHDVETYQKYTDRTPDTVAKHGGKFLTRGEPVTTLEGQEYSGRMVLLEFPSSAHIRTWMADPDYEAAVRFRHDASTMHMLLLQEGGANTENPDPRL